MIWSLIVGGILGWLASLITGRDVPGGVIGNIIAGIIGSWIGGKLLGSFGPVIGGYAIIPALIGAINLINSQKFSRLQILISGGIMGPRPCSP
ncbi:GlsB/YeaQ/YmgE family stress response membrane protein [Bacillus sp. B-TM1]